MSVASITPHTPRGSAPTRSSTRPAARATRTTAVAAPTGADAKDRLRSVPALAGAVTVPPVVSAGLQSPTLLGTSVDYANFDHAASTPALVSVKQAVDTALVTYSSVHRGNGYASRITSAWYEAAREEVRVFVGARESDEVVFTRNTTDAVNLLARALPRNTTVFVFDSEHHATLLPWNPRQTVRLPVPVTEDDAEALLENALQSTGGRNRLVVLSGASNVTGELWPLERLTAVARRHRARILLDAAQYAPHRRIDLETLDVDYVAFSGHKLYAPYGAGVLVGSRDWLDAAPPYLAGGGATRAVTQEGVHWQVGAARHEAGSPNVIGAVALAAACAAIREHREAIEHHEARLARRLLDGLAEIDGVQTYSIFGEHQDRVAVATFTVDGLDSSLVSAALSAEHGIGVRDGKFCAHLLVDELLQEAHGPGTQQGVASGCEAPSPYAAGAPTTAVRASVGLATTDEHVDRLLAAVRSLAEHGPVATYAQEAGQGWAPLDDPRDLSAPLPW